MNSVSSTSRTGSYHYAMQRKTLEKRDADQDGALDRDDVLSGKPKNTDQDHTSRLYDALDVEKSGISSMVELTPGETFAPPGAGLLGTLSSDALDVLMQMQQQGGMMAGGSRSAGDAAHDAPDADKDGVVVSEDGFKTISNAATPNAALNLFDMLATGELKSS